MSKIITKTDIVKDIAKELNMPQRDVSLVINKFIEKIKKGVMKGIVRITGLGAFTLTEVKSKEIKVFGKDKKVIPAHKKIKFRPSKVWKKEVF